MKVLLKDYTYSPSEFSIDFHSAGASSLNLHIFALFKGEFANKRMQILKDLQGILLRICTEERLNIPFNQVVVHLPANLSSSHATS
jgi:small-conductance mechanosensitive channel